MSLITDRMKSARTQSSLLVDDITLTKFKGKLTQRQFKRFN